MNSSTSYFVLSNRAYDFFRRLVQIILPATGALYFGLSQIWGLPAGEEVVGTIALITTFLGVTLGISNKGYEESGAAYDGAVVVTEREDGTRVFNLELDEAPDDLEEKKAIRFRVLSVPKE